MPRPKTKDDLIEYSQTNFKILNDFIDSFSKKKMNMEFQKGTLNRNIKDVLAHLHHWNLLTLGWYEAGMKGEKIDMPAKGFTWKTLPDLNKSIWEKYKDADLIQIRVMLNDSFNELQKVMRKHTDKELFEKKKYKWTGTTSLGSYLVSSCSSHYVWAHKLIKKATK